MHLTRILLDDRAVIGFRRPKNISDILCRSDIKLDSPFVNKNALPICPQLGRCKHCPRLNKTGKIWSNHTGRKYLIPKKITCRSSNVIYCINCMTCGMQYVGQTKNELRQRVNNHLSTIRNRVDTPVARHFNRIHNETNNPSIKLSILQLIRSNDQRMDLISRNKWENIWIGRLCTISPFGLNIQD